MHEKLLSLASLILDFGRVDRKTHHQDGETSESDTDHTVMLGIISCAIAERLYPKLDRGRIAEYALVHDLVEVHCGDTPTLIQSTESEAKEKEKRELQALRQIKEEYGMIFPWIHTTIESYESLSTPEARYVKTVDKILPKIVTVLNKAKAWNKTRYVTRSQAEQVHDMQKIKLQGLVSDMPEILEIWEYFADEQLRVLVE